MAENFEITDKHIQWTLQKFAEALKNKENAKILWGNRSIWKKDWIVLKRFLGEQNIKTVLEYGCGLSTELMVLEGIEVVSLETLDWWAEINRRVIGNEIIGYKEGSLPKIDRRFDLAFVDGPQSGQRVPEIIHAKERSDVIFFHDLDSNRIKAVEELMKDWKVIERYTGQFWKKI